MARTSSPAGIPGGRLSGAAQTVHIHVHHHHGPTTVHHSEGSGDKNFIAGAIKHPGALHRELGVPQGEKIPVKKIAAAAKKGGKLGERARFAETLSHLRPKKR